MGTTHGKPGRSANHDEDADEFKTYNGKSSDASEHYRGSLADAPGMTGGGRQLRRGPLAFGGTVHFNGKDWERSTGGRYAYSDSDRDTYSDSDSDLYTDTDTDTDTETDSDSDSEADTRSMASDSTYSDSSTGSSSTDRSRSKSRSASTSTTGGRARSTGTLWFDRKTKQFTTETITPPPRAATGGRHFLDSMTFSDTLGTWVPAHENPDM